MCGICGIVGDALLSELQVQSVKQMNGAMVHRGPDSEGLFQDAHICLAMRRLSIIDLECGNQPLFNEDESLVIIANGEIYNYVELRSNLIADGHRFKTSSDCETILHLYEDFGINCVHHMRGMFAFALWDKKLSRLMLARDRMGEKPLYLYQAHGMLFFASELKALLKSGFVPFDIDSEAINLYFHYQYVPEPRTPIKNVRKLDAAHLLTVDVEPWKIAETCYWNMEDVPEVAGDPATLIRQELETISEIVIRSDVPVGIALSGGLDSSAVAALAARRYSGTIHAFSVGYPGSFANDERQDARDLADYLGMPFHDIELDTNHFVEFFPDLIYLQDDPIADISGFGYYSVSKIARENGVPVMLQGQGGDELFWGYSWVREAARLSYTKAAILSTRQSPWTAYLKLAAPSDFTRSSLRSWLRSWAGLKLGRKALNTHSGSPHDQMFFYDLAPDFSDTAREISSFYTKEFLNTLNGEQATKIFSFSHPWKHIGVKITRLICDTYLRENGIAQGDRLSMASSVELRLPLVDHKLIELVVGLRKMCSDLNNTPKEWFRSAIKQILPQWVLNRPKRGFTPPVKQWHKAIFSAYGDKLLNGRLVQIGILTPQGAEVLTKGPFPPTAVAPLSFKALVLELWCQQFMKLTS